MNSNLTTSWALMSLFGPKNHAKTEKNSAVIHAIPETALVVMTVEVIHAAIIAMTAATVVTEETNAPRSTITIGRAQNAKIPTLPSGKHATDVKPPVLVAVEVLGTTEAVRTEGHNEMVADTSDMVETIGKKFTTIMIGHAESVITQISHSVKPATDVKHPALVAVEDDPVEEIEAETVVETDAVAADTAEEIEAETVVETDAVAVDTAEGTEAETVVETGAVAAEDTAEETEAETVVETDAVAAEDAAEETEAEIVVETGAVAAEDTAEETEVETVVETVVETDAVAAETVVIAIDAHKATTQIIVMQRENAQGTLTIGDQTTSNRRRTTDTTIDWGLTT